jgi:phage gpG-like protein
VSDPVRIELSPEAKALIARLGTAHGWMPATMARAMQRENELTISHIQTERMAGNNNVPFPVSEHKLGVRTARLRRSLNAPRPFFSGTQVVSSIGTNVEYAASHELGNHSTVTVPAHTRTRKRRVRVETVDKLGKRRTRTKSVWGDAFAVRSYSMQMNIEARAPITTGVAERLPALGEAISADIVAGFGKVGLT